MIRPILIHPDPRLKKVCAPVAGVDAAVRALMADLLQTMYGAPGIGLAAPQVGVLSRVLVIDCNTGEDDEPDPVCLANPEITWSSEAAHEHEEGCLSIPEIYAMITRPDAVRVRYLDRAGREIEREFHGVQATCVQHEIDHLSGKLFIDYLSPTRRQMITGKMKKLKRERARTRTAAE
ncbi:MAG: peptide deformylase [Proteobacteria bacterium]|nr:peptide deformylase [Pseudomonadota bacterium]MCH8951750.1 peptide deformylase [Pseudomonadota bacterium]